MSQSNYSFGKIVPIGKLNLFQISTIEVLDFRLSNIPQVSQYRGGVLKEYWIIPDPWNVWTEHCVVPDPCHTWTKGDLVNARFSTVEELMQTLSEDKKWRNQIEAKICKTFVPERPRDGFGWDYSVQQVDGFGPVPSIVLGTPQNMEWVYENGVRVRPTTSSG